MRQFLTLPLIFLFGVSFGQTFSYPTIKSKGQFIVDFVPGGWTILDTASGDLNKDGANDLAIVLQLKDSVRLVNKEQDSIFTQPRILIILFKNPSGSIYDLVESSNSFILNHNNPSMDDPYKELAIKNGLLQIKFSLFYNMGTWTATNVTYKFGYQEGVFVLIGADNYSLDRANMDYEDYSYNFLTKKRSLTVGNEEKGTKKTSWKAVALSSKNLKTFVPFTYEVERGFFL